MKHFIVHCIQIIRTHPTSHTLTTAVAHDFQMWTADVPQAYLQSKEQTLRPSIIKRELPEFELSSEEVLN